jgi:hypothetical protein
VVRRWNAEIVAAVKAWEWSLRNRGGASDEDASALATKLIEMTRDEPEGDSSTEGFVDHDSLDDVLLDSKEEVGGTEADSTPTVLGRLRPDQAFRLLLRGYVNTYVESTLLKPISYRDRLSLKSIQERLRRMVPGLSASDGPPSERLAQ